MTTFYLHPKWVERDGLYSVCQSLHNKGLCVTAPVGKKFFCASPIEPKPETLVDKILTELRRNK